MPTSLYKGKYENSLSACPDRVAIGFVFATFAGQKDAIDPKIDQQIRALAWKFGEAYNKYDPGAVAARYTEDAVRFNADNSTFYGRKAIEKSFCRR
jgi:hypothetical protein